jgi:beta-N-acetylhexosaminidase
MKGKGLQATFKKMNHLCNWAMRTTLFTIFFILLFSFSLKAQSWEKGQYSNKWSDSVLNTLSLKQQIAQMMMVAAWSNKGAEHIADIENLIQMHGVGGICFFQGHPLKQAYLTNYFQQISTVPLLVSIDAEWGLAMRLREVEKFPFQMTLGAAHNDSLTYLCGLGIGKQCKRMGIHVNFAPDVDVNTNPNNPIIGFRSFGENTEDIALSWSW